MKKFSYIKTSLLLYRNCLYMYLWCAEIEVCLDFVLVLNGGRQHIIYGENLEFKWMVHNLQSCELSFQYRSHIFNTCTWNCIGTVHLFPLTRLLHS
jgi:hypothetical protein